MATYVNDLRLKEIGTGESSGTWGTETNVNLELIGEALGYGTEGITTNADTHTTTVADGSTDPGRAMYIEYTGTLDSACTITIAPNTLSRLHYIENGTSGSQNIIIKQGSGATVTIPPGDTKAVYLDGAGSGAKVVDVFASFSVVDLKVQDDLTVTDDATVGGTLGVTGILTCTDDIIIGDGKTIGSASDVDAITIAANGQVTFTQTLIGTALDISGDIDVDGTANLDIVDIDGATNIAAAVTMATNNKIQFRDDAIHISSTADGQLDLVADTEIQIAATTIDINGAINASGEIIAASLDISGNIDVDGTTNLDVVDIDGAVDMASTLQVDGAITSSAGATISTTGQEFQLILTSTDADALQGPRLKLYRNSSSPADGDATGEFTFVGRNDNSQDVNYFQIRTDATDVSDGSEDATVHFFHMRAGTARSSMAFKPTETVFNDDTQDLDFRVESDGNANMLFVDAGNDRVGIGISPEQILHIKDTSNPGATTGSVIIEGARDGIANCLEIRSRDASNPTGVLPINHGQIIRFTGFDGTDFEEMAMIGTIAEANVADGDAPSSLFFGTTKDSDGSATEHMRLTSAGFLGIGTTSPGLPLDVRGNQGSPASSGTTQVGSLSIRGTGSHFMTSGMLNVSPYTGWFQSQDANNLSVEYPLALNPNGGNVGINTTTPNAPLTIQTSSSTGSQAALRLNNPFGFGDANTGCEIIFSQDRSASENLKMAAIVSGQESQGSSANGYLRFFTTLSSSITEKLRFNASGRQLGFTSVNLEPGNTPTDANCYVIGPGYMFLNRDDTASVDQVTFGKNGAVAGRITTSSSTTYTTTSDYRRKENITPVVSGLERVQKLNPVSYTWIDDEVKVTEEGFIAHEVQEAGWTTGISGEKDGEDVQSMDYGRITPLLVKAIQEQQAQIDALQSEIKILKGE